MAILNITFCISVFVACVIVSTPLVQGRSLRRRHGHHSHSNYYNLEESLPRDLSKRLEDDLEYYRDYYGQTKKREYPQVLDRSSEYEDSEEQVSPSLPPFLPRYENEYSSRGRESLRRKEDSLRKYDDFDVFSRIVARRKRHNKQRGSNGRYQDKNYHYDSFEMEVKVAQNHSICNYTVESIPDQSGGSRIPRDLEHVRCNHLGSRCQGTSTYCCIQTYRNIEVSYGNGHNETMKLYVGCVCAFQDTHYLNNMQSLMQSQLAIKDWHRGFVRVIRRGGGWPAVTIRFGNDKFALVTSVIGGDLLRIGTNRARRVLGGTAIETKWETQLLLSHMTLQSTIHRRLSFLFLFA